LQDIIFFADQGEFSAWLGANVDANELWVGYHKKSTKRGGLDWSSSVDVALCFGWIDGIRKTIDEHSYKIRFTPRKVNSVWSAVNVKKVNTLILLGKMRPAGLLVFNQRSDEKGYSSNDRNIPLKAEYEQQIKTNETAWTFFNSLAPSYKRDSIWWVMSAKKQETQLRRLEVLINSSEASWKIPSLRKN
jgi:uncharacterized protein YdeI (YjbR/CyaY-like superfamily)